MERTEKELISVVIPIYGNFSIDRILMCIDSIKCQQEVSVEIVVSEQGTKRRMPVVEGIKHIFTFFKPRKDFRDFNPGKVRNIAILNSAGSYIYTVDADIIFTDPLFLRKSLNFLKTNPKNVLYRPYMRRLPKDNFSTFLEWYDENGIKQAMKKLVKNQEFLVKTTEDYRELKVFEKQSKEAGYKKTFTALIQDYEQYVEERLGNDDEFNFWPLYWLENRHCGSNLFRRQHFFEVGGYANTFVNWGCEDSDLQWKFREKYNLIFFPSDLEVVHLDHNRSHISPQKWDSNEKVCSIRKKRGVTSAIEIDGHNLKNIHYLED